MPALNPALYVGGVNLNNRYSLEVLWKQTEGLFDGSALDPGATIATFDGPAKVRSHDMAYQARRIVITGRIINRSGWMEKQVAIADLAEAFAGRPAIVRLGTLELECEFGAVRLVDDAYSHLPGYQTWRVEGEAVPGVYISQYHAALGADQGLAVQDDRVDSSAVKFSSNSFTYTNPGTAPTEACVALVGTASTTYYLKGLGLRRVPMTTDAAGNATIDEMSGFLVYPGSNAIRVEDSAGALASGVTLVNLYGTRPRFLGNATTAATTQSATTNRMSEGPMLTPHRTGNKTYISTAGTLTTATDGTAAIGVPSGTYSASKAGLVLEGAGTNLVTYSEQIDNAAWTKVRLNTTGAPAYVNVTAAPDGTTTADKLIEDTTASNTHFAYHSTASLGDNTVYTWSVFAKAGERSKVGLVLNTKSGVLVTRIFDLSDGTSAAPTDGGFTGASIYAIEAVGDGWYRISVTTDSLTGAGSAFPRVYLHDGSTLSYTGDGTSGVYVWGAQLEARPFATSYIATTSAAVARNADLCGIVPPHNLLKYSEQLDNAVWTNHANLTVTADNTAAPDGTMTAEKLAKTAATNISIRQAITGKAVTYTFSVWLKAGTLTSADLLIYNATTAAALSAFTTVTLTTSWQRFTVTATSLPSAGDTVEAYIYPLRSTASAGDIYAWGAQLVEGSQPGPYVRTTDTAIPAPVTPALDPAWAQNGAIEGYFVPPSISTGTTAGIVGATQSGVAAGDLRLYRSSGAAIGSQALTYDRKHDGASGSGGSAGRGMLSTTATVYDGARHKFKIEWLNYTLSGVRYMVQRVYIDDALQAEQDVAALYGATSWATIDASKMVSDGNVFATLSVPDGVPMLDYPTLPAGAIPAV